MAVIILSLENDYHTDAVVHNLLKKNVKVIRIDPTSDARLPKFVKIYSDRKKATSYNFKDGSGIDFNQVTGVYCRFALETLVPSQNNNAIKYFKDSEELAVFLAPLRCIESSKWINDPWIESRSDCRILQSNLAISLGLSVPEFIVSNSYNELIEFHDKHMNVIIKSISDAPLAQIDDEFVVPERIGLRKYKAPYTTQFVPNIIKNVDCIDDTPTMLQAKIDKKADIRATIIDNKIFSALMPYTYGEPVDFRCNPSIRVEAFELPINIQNKLIQLLKLMRVRFASCDLLLDKSGDYHFLEANVQGNWLWTEQGADLRISEAIANALSKSAII
jgi:hypothetical protein